MARTVFMGGRVFDGGSTPGQPTYCSRRRPCRGGSARSSARPGRGPRWSTSRAGWSPRASPTPTSTPSRVVSSAPGATSRNCRPGPTTSPASGSTPPPTLGRAWLLGGGWAMRSSPAARPPPTTSRRWPPSAGLPAQPRPPRRLGQSRRSWRWPASTVTRPTPPTAGSSATPTATRPAPSTRARWHWSRGWCRPPPRQEYDAGLLAGQAHLHSLGVTGWQDAIVGAYAGMDDPWARPIAARPCGAR